MAEELNMHFSSVFTREDTSSLPVPEPGRSTLYLSTSVLKYNL